jgi:hypothetical protein
MSSETLKGECSKFIEVTEIIYLHKFKHRHLRRLEGGYTLHTAMRPSLLALQSHSLSGVHARESTLVRAWATLEPSTPPFAHYHVVTCCSVLRSLSCPIHPSLLPPHQFIPNSHPPTYPSTCSFNTANGLSLLLRLHSHTRTFMSLPPVSKGTCESGREGGRERGRKNNAICPVELST